MAKKSNKWTRPDAPPPPLFLGEKERNLVKQVNDELIERVIGQTIIYYPVSLEHTNFHNLYGEAIEKSFYPLLRNKNRCFAHDKTRTLPEFMRSVTRKQAFFKNEF